MSGHTSRLFLTGFSGSGKSTVAKLVAAALGWQAVDTDTLIERDAGRTIADIFEREGEARFRERERDAIRQAAAQERVVVATGGGAIVSEENRCAMAESGRVVLLDARPHTVLERMNAGDETSISERPLLAGDDPLASAIELKARRAKLYALADAVIETDASTPEEVAEAVTEVARAEDPWFEEHPTRLLLPDERGQPVEPYWVEASRHYAVHAGWGALDRLGELLRGLDFSGAAYVISDTNVLAGHGDRALASLRDAGFAADAFAVEPGEASKSLDAASQIYDWLVEHRAERGHPIVALGGGMVGDLAGFVAATYLRGLPFVQAPTSLLAMVDAAIGGKVAVDHRAGKNLIGAFYQPWLVVEDVSALKTLPRRALLEGFAEVIKHALVLDPQLLADLETRADDLLHLEPAFTVDVVRRNAAIKGGMVAKDEFDRGPRAVLNYGHTLGHAIEVAAGYGILHGEAVSAGMMAAAEIGRRMGVTPPELVERQRALLERYGLPARGPAVDPARVLDAILLDKKVSAGAVRWVLLEDVGRAVLRSDVPPDVVADVVREVLSPRPVDGT